MDFVLEMIWIKYRCILNKVDALIQQNWLAFAAHCSVIVGLLIIFNVMKPNTNLDLLRDGIPGPGVTTNNSGSFNPKCDINFPFETKTVASFNVYRAVLAFFIITAIAHLFYATDGFNTGIYTGMIAEGWNWIRWLEYGLSASIMSFTIGAADGTRNYPVLLGLSLMTVALQLQGLSIESEFKRNKAVQTAVSSLKALYGPSSDTLQAVQMLSKDASFNWAQVITSTVSGWILFATLFFIILYNFFSVIMDVRHQYDTSVYPDAKVPGWLYFIGPLQFFLYGSFGIVQLLQLSDQARGTLKPFAVYEGYYILLSFIAKIALASGLAYGLAFRQVGC